MAILSHVNVKQTWVGPLPKKVDILEDLKPKLKPSQNDFQLKKQLMLTVSAGASYEQASAYGVVDLKNGQVIASKNLSERVPIASLTKIMTAVVALDLAGVGEQFSVSARAASQQPTKVMLKTGEKYSLNNLLSFLLISSANDSAEVIKEGIDTKYGNEVFIKAMNYKAQALGLKNTHFTNTQGYDDANNYSSVEDITILSRYALENYPLIAEIVGKNYEDLTDNYNDLRFYLNNWNGLLGVYPGVSGIKIGNTSKAGKCTVVIAVRNGQKLLAIVLGAPGVLERDLWAAQLLDLGFSKIAGIPPVNVTESQLKEKYASWKYFE